MSSTSAISADVNPTFTIWALSPAGKSRNLDAAERKPLNPAHDRLLTSSLGFRSGCSPATDCG